MQHNKRLNECFNNDPGRDFTSVVWKILLNNIIKSYNMKHWFYHFLYIP